MKISRDGANQEPERETPLPAEQEIEEATLPEPPKEVYHAKRQKPEKPPKPKKEKPPRRRREPEPEEEGEEEVRRHHFPVGLLLPLSPLGRVMDMVPVPPAYYLWLPAAVLCYMLLTAVIKKVYIRRYGELL